jgi:nitrogen-specific signal transduction histidine kinase
MFVSGNRLMHRNQMLLVAARKLAEQASLSKTRFLATVSHDMRTPLNGLLGTVELLLDGEHPPEVTEQLEVAKVCGKTLRVLVDETLDLSRLESGGLELRAEDFSPKRLLADVATVVRSVLEPEVRLDLEDIADLPPLRGDAGRCQQIVLNLASNAAKSTLEGRSPSRPPAAMASGRSRSPTPVWASPAKSSIRSSSHSGKAELVAANEALCPSAESGGEAPAVAKIEHRASRSVQ